MLGPFAFTKVKSLPIAKTKKSGGTIVPVIRHRLNLDILWTNDGSGFTEPSSRYSIGTDRRPVRRRQPL